jgi:hypothetical protein
VAALELARLDVRCTGLTDLVLEDVVFRERVDLCSSAGGEGKLPDAIVAVAIISMVFQVK